MAHHTEGKRVDQGVTRVAGVKDHLAADVGQTEAVAVAGDAGHHAWENTSRVGCIGRTEAQWVHDCHRSGTHGDDVADDPAHAGSRTLVGLNETRVVVGFNFEGDGQAVADIHHACVLADADQQGLGLGGLLAELPQVHFGRLVGAVFTPHHRVHGQLGVGGSTPQDVADALVLVVLQAQIPPRLFVVGSCGCDFDGVDVGAHVKQSMAAVRARCSAVDQCGQHRGEQPQAIGSGAGEILNGVLGVRHEAHHVARGVGDPGDIAT